MILAADTLPSNAGYVVAAYLVFLLLILVYLAITVLRLSRLERELASLDELPAVREADSS